MLGGKGTLPNGRTYAASISRESGSPPESIRTEIPPAKLRNRPRDPAPLLMPTENGRGLQHQAERFILGEEFLPRLHRVAT